MLCNEIEKCDGVKSLSGSGSNGTSIIIGHEKATSKSKRDHSEVISIQCDHHRLALAIFPFFKENTFLVKNNNYLICLFYYLLH